MKTQVLLVFFGFPFALKPRAKGSVKKIKSVLLILILFVTYNGMARQESNQRVLRNVLKINPFNLSVFGGLNLSYEYLLCENQSIGVGIFM